MSLKQHIVDTGPNDTNFKHQMEFHSSLRSLLKVSKKYQDGANSLNTTELPAFYNEMLSLSQLPFITSSSKPLNLALFKYGSSLLNLANVHTQMSELLGTSFYEPLTSFLDHDFQESIEVKSRRDKTISEYETMLGKMEDLVKKGKIDDPKKMMTFERELESLKKSMVNLDQELSKKLEHLESKKEWKFLTYMYRCIELQAIYFQSGNKIFQDLLSKLDSVKKHMDELAVTSPNRNIVEGYLSKKSDKLGRGWHKWWFVLRDGYLYYYKKNSDFDSTRHAINTLLCTVRVGGNTATAPISKKKEKESKDNSTNEQQQWTFEIILSDANRKPIMLQTDTEEDRDRWVRALQGSISNSLNSQDVEALAESKDDSFDTTKKSPVDSSEDSAQQAWRILQKVEGNNNCVDCGASNPDWASINLGVLMCLECSGVHRSLGVHISKIRSLTLDKWDSEIVLFMKNVGNAAFNRIYEYDLQGVQKPTHVDDRETREKYIKSKYVEKLFLEPLDAHPILAVENHIENTSGNVVELLKLLGHCGNYELETLKKSEKGKQNILHATVVSNNLLYATALLQNGISANYVEETQGWSALHFAAFYDRPHLARVLLKHTRKNEGVIGEKDFAGRSPLELSVECGSKQVEAIIKGLKTSTDNPPLTLDDIENDKESNILPALFQVRENASPSAGMLKYTKRHTTHFGTKSFENLTQNTSQNTTQNIAQVQNAPQVLPLTQTRSGNTLKKPDKPLPPPKPLPRPPPKQSDNGSSLNLSQSPPEKQRPATVNNEREFVVDGANFMDEQAKYNDNYENASNSDDSSPNRHIPPFRKPPIPFSPTKPQSLV
eukprot:TRINITY_DN1384_c0_g2_i2.p1 TRINITY_DN1384_c0_g2~~TRINITY_DN1384_c0_g2_i2.p1  ORF type:complete len:833 (-),score=193.36 TRINITY_DN1384_c0_g2_i2:38-2536(-)